MNYILIADDEADIRDILEMILKRSFPLEVLTASSGNEALEIIRQKGKPQVIISDFKMPDGDGLFLYNGLIENDWSIPFILCTTEAEKIMKSHFPGIHGFIEKPNITDAAIKLVDKVVNQYLRSPDFVPVKISLLLRWGIVNYDLFMKLSETRYVKVVNAGEAFLAEDGERFTSKGLSYLHITAHDADAYLKAFENNISMVMNSGTYTSEMPFISADSLEVIERLARVVGWTPAVVESAKKAVELAIKTISLEPNIFKLLKKRMSDMESNYAYHVRMLSLLSCGFCHNLGWVSESTQMKLGLASLMHDLAVEESYYSDINLWNEAASTGTDTTEEVLKYRNHPIEAANLVLSMRNVPSDVDQIILQHHEAKDGGGFPRGLNSSRILPLTCVLIISEDLLDYIQGAENIEERVDNFFKYRKSKYDSGNFKKVFDAITDSVEKMRLNQ